MRRNVGEALTFASIGIVGGDLSGNLIIPFHSPLQQDFENTGNFDQPPNLALATAVLVFSDKAAHLKIEVHTQNPLERS